MAEFTYPQRWPLEPGCQTPWSPSLGETASPSAGGGGGVAVRLGTHLPTHPVPQLSISLKKEARHSFPVFPTNSFIFYLNILHLCQRNFPGEKIKMYPFSKTDHDWKMFLFNYTLGDYVSGMGGFASLASVDQTVWILEHHGQSRFNYSSLPLKPARSSPFHLSLVMALDLLSSLHPYSASSV